MKFEIINGAVFVELTRRNLEALLLKLDLPDGESARMLTCHSTEGAQVFVRAVPNEEHYEDRPAGEMHPREEAKLDKPATGTKLYDYPA